MSRIVSEIIRSKVSTDAIDATAAANLVAMIHDALPADARLDDIDRAIAQARAAFSPLFRTPVPMPQAESTGPEPMHLRMAREAGKVASTARTATDRVSAALASGNPWQTGNVTHQELVSFLDPASAARLKRDAGR